MSLTFDEILVKHTGQFGKYQLLRVLLLSTMNMFICFTSMSAVFIADNPTHHCELPTELLKLNCTDQQFKAYAIPVVLKDGKETNDQCQLFRMKSTNLTEEDVCPNNRGNESSSGMASNREKVACNSWHFDTSVYESTVVTEWNLVCDRAWLAKNTAGLYMGARIIGTFICGWLADRFGRKLILVITGFIDGASFLLSGLMPTYTTFIICKVIQGFVSLGFFTSGYVLAMDLVGPKYRVFAGSFIMVAWAIGYLILPLIAYFLTNWRNLVIILGSVQLSFSILYILFLPESPRWLLLKKKYEKAHMVIHKIARVNGRDISGLDTADVIVKNDSSNAATPIDLFRRPAIRLVSLNLFFAWFVVSFVYYGIAMNITDLGGNVYINFVISAATELPAYCLGILLPMYYGRVVPLASTFLVSGISLLLVIAVPNNLSWPVILLAMTGKFFNAIAFSLLYIFTSEVYCTNVRSLGLSSNSTCARIGATVGVYAGLLVQVHRALPQVVFAVPSLLVGILALGLPETKGEQLTQTIEQSEEFISKKSCALCTRCMKRSNKDPTNTLPESPSQCTNGPEQEFLSHTTQA